MKDRTAGYIAEQALFTTQPTYMVRFFSVKKYGDSVDYPFSVDFASRDVLSPTKDKVLIVAEMGGGPAQVFPDEGRADIGGFTILLTDLAGEALKYFSAPQYTLNEAIGASDTSIELAGDISGLPAQGTIIIGTGDTAERVRYSSYEVFLLEEGESDDISVITVSERGADDTDAASHSMGAVVTNGEQIKPGTRAQVFLGYHNLVESDFMSFAKMEVFERRMTDDLAGFSVEIQDIQRTTARDIFLNASTEAPFNLSGNPLTIALQILLSTGDGTNGTYDVLAKENGLGIPAVWVDVDEIEDLRDTSFSGITMSFSITGRESARTFLENEIYAVLNVYPLVNQTGQLTLRSHSLSSGASALTLTHDDFTIKAWSFGDRLTINHVVFEYGWNGTEFTETLEAEVAASIEKYGTKQAKVVSSKGLPANAASATFLKTRADEILERYSDPPPVLEVEAQFRNHHVDPGDLISVTSAFLPNPSTGLRGITAEQFELINMSVNWVSGRIGMTLLDVDAIEPATVTVTSRTFVGETVGLDEALTPHGPKTEDVALTESLEVDVSSGPAEGVDLDENLGTELNP